jgi:L-ascorbate metabolism protein UlaG (beta-lactamase superfamily)
LALARQHKPKVVSTFETYLWLESKDTGAQGLPGNKGGSQKVGDFEITMTQALHSNSIDENGQRIYAGEAGGDVVKRPGGASIYHAGDTAMFGDMKLISDIYKPDVTCLPIGDVFTMGPREAAVAIRLFGVKHVIPMRYALFPLLPGTPEALRAESKDIPGANSRLEAGRESGVRKNFAWPVFRNGKNCGRRRPGSPGARPGGA